MPLPAAALLAVPAASAAIGLLTRGKARYDSGELEEFVQGLQNDPSFLERYQRLAAAGAPTTDSLLSAMRVANPGLSSGASAALAGNQAKAQSFRNQSNAFTAFQAGQGQRQGLVGSLLAQIASGKAGARAFNANTRNQIIGSGLNAYNTIAGNQLGMSQSQYGVGNLGLGGAPQQQVGGAPQGGGVSWPSQIPTGRTPDFNPYATSVYGNFGLGG